MLHQIVKKILHLQDFLFAIPHKSHKNRNSNYSECERFTYVKRAIHITSQKTFIHDIARYKPFIRLDECKKDITN